MLLSDNCAFLSPLLFRVTDYVSIFVPVALFKKKEKFYLLRNAGQKSFDAVVILLLITYV